MSANLVGQYFLFVTWTEQHILAALRALKTNDSGLKPLTTPTPQPFRLKG